VHPGWWEGTYAVGILITAKDPKKGVTNAALQIGPPTFPDLRTIPSRRLQGHNELDLLSTLDLFASLLLLSDRKRQHGILIPNNAGMLRRVSGVIVTVLPVALGGEGGGEAGVVTFGRFLIEVYPLRLLLQR
jgi:hypothetical protein